MVSFHGTETMLILASERRSKAPTVGWSQQSTTAAGWQSQNIGYEQYADS